MNSSVKNQQKATGLEESCGGFQQVNPGHEASIGHLEGLLDLRKSVAARPTLVYLSPASQE